MAPQTLKSVSPEVLDIIADAREAESARNLSMMEKALEPLWPDVSIDPDYSAFPTLIEADLLRLSGYYLSALGKYQSVPGMHARAKDMLSTAIGLFGSEGATESETEAYVLLALSYWYAGEVEESIAMLDTLEQQFDNDPSNPIYLQIQINRFITLYFREMYDEALVLIESLAGPVADCGVPRLIAMYHNQAGLIYERFGRCDIAYRHIEQAITRCLGAGDERLAALNLNNLAMVYLRSGEYERAIDAADRAIAVFTALKDHGWRPHAVDTKALILMETGDHLSALSILDEAVREFEKGSDAAGLAESMFNRIRCLLRLGRTSDALDHFGRLHAIAASRIGTVAVNKYSNALAAELEAVAGSGRKPTAEQIVRVQGLDHQIPVEGVEIFSFPPTVMQRFGIETGALVAAVRLGPSDRLTAGACVLYSFDGKLSVGRVEYEADLTGLHYLVHEGVETLIDDVAIAGILIGCRSLSDDRRPASAFRPMPSLIY